MKITRGVKAYEKVRNHNSNIGKSSAGKVFNTFTNHENYRQIPLVLSSELVKYGENNTANGKNARRVVRLVGGTLNETVSDIDYPNYWDYQFSQWLLPLDHLGGRMLFEQVSNGTLVTWSTSYDATKLPKVMIKTINAINTSFLHFAAKRLRNMALET